jgi:hypothetical protein
MHPSARITAAIEPMVMGWLEHRTRVGMENACTILVDTPEFKKPLGEHTLKWDDILKVCLT